jgi:hypothetical protein
VVLQQVVVWVGAAVFTLLLVVLVTLLFQRRLKRAASEASPGSWTGGCVDPQQSRAWSALVIDDRGITVKSLWSKEIRYRFRWSEVDIPASGPHDMRIGLRHCEGLRIQLATGSHVDLLLPSRGLLHYPKARVTSALAAMRRHR